MFAVMWYVTEMDIRSTLFAACRKVTRDKSVDEKSRLLRCQALKLIGEQFLKSGNSAEAGLKDIKNRLKDQMAPRSTENRQEDIYHEEHDNLSNQNNDNSSTTTPEVKSTTTSYSSTDLD
jgi:hypothetical protein